jgi:hypothetical protein
VGAKHSLDMNYLPLAWTGGAQLFTQTEVQRIEKTGDHYRLHCVLRSGWLFGQEAAALTARTVIVAAGTLGSNELLLRSRDVGGLAVSDRLGKNFSGNGNHIWFVDYQFSKATVTRTPPASALRGGRRRRRSGLPSRASSTSDAAIVRCSVASCSRTSPRRARWRAGWRRCS